MIVIEMFYAYLSEMNHSFRVLAISILDIVSMSMGQNTVK